MAALAVALLSATPVRAATPSNGANLTDISFVFDSMPLSSKGFVLVGCDGSSPSRIGRIQMVDVKAGRTAWEDRIASRDACLLSVVATPDRVYDWGIVQDDDGDIGRNLLVEARSSKDGTLIWRQEIEAPNPKQDFNKPLTGRPNIALQGTKLMIFAGTTGNANPTVLLRIDASTGALLPANP
jgi:hypothetical protein